MSQGSGRKMPSKGAIRKYWAPKLSDGDDPKFDSPAECMEADYCFACGQIDGDVRTWTERCHILPKCDGGSDKVENLHLLCRTCHRMSEYLSGDEYWAWFNTPRHFTHMPVVRVFYGHGSPYDYVQFIKAVRTMSNQEVDALYMAVEEARCKR